MTKVLTFRKVMLLAAVTTIIAVGIAYAVEIQRGVGGSLVVGKVETAEETILLYSSMEPSKVPLTELDFGITDVTAFGLFRQRPAIPVYVENGGDVPFALGVEATDVRVNGAPVGNALALDIRSIPVPTPTPAPTAAPATPAPTAAPAATPTPASAAAPGGAFEELDFRPLLTPTPTPTPTPRRPLPTVAVIRPGQVVGFQVGLRFLRTPKDLGVKTDDRITFTALFRAQGPVFIPTPTPTAAPRPTPIATPTPTPVSPPKFGGIPSVHSFFDPGSRLLHQDSFTLLSSFSPLYNQLLELNPETEVIDDIRGDLAVGWELFPDGRTYNFAIHTQAKWWDGVPVTAADVKLSLDSLADPNAVNGLQGTSRSIESNTYYESSQIIDDKTIRVVIKYPAPSFLFYFASDKMKILPKHKLDAGIAQGSAEPLNMLGSGPFRLKDFQREVSITFEKNAGYFKPGYPRFDGMAYFHISDSVTVTAAFLTGQVRFSSSAVNNLSVEDGVRLAEEMVGKAQVHFATPGFNVGLLLNTRVPPFDDARIRRAMMLVLHRHPMINAFGAGEYLLGTPIAPGFWFSSTSEQAAQIPGFRELNGKKHPDDVALARELLAEAGYPNGLGATLTCAAPPYCDVAAVVQQQLKDFLGWDVEIEQVDFPAGIAVYDAGDFVFAVQPTFSVVPDADGALTPYLSGSNGARWTGHTNPVIAEINQIQTREFNRDIRLEHLLKIQQYLLQDTSLPNLYYTTRPAVVWNNIKNYRPAPWLYTHKKHEHLWCDPSC